MPSAPPFSLDDLAAAAGESPRTIRFWIQEGLLPAALGGGRAAFYSQDHMDRLMFITRVRQQVGGRLPLGMLRHTLDQLWATNPDIVRRVARGEEAVHVADLMTGTTPSPIQPPPTPPRRSSADTGQPGKAPGAQNSTQRTHAAATWTTIQLRDGLELRLRTDDPERVAWLARVARRLRQWLEAGDT